MPATDRFPECDILILAWRHEIPIDGEIVDPIWTALRDAFGFAPRENEQPYERSYDRVLAELRAYRMFQERRDAPYTLHPRLEGHFGRYLTTDMGGRRICLFRSDLRINTDGPTMPVLRMIRQILGEARPRLVLSVGLGGGTGEVDQVGDIVITPRARYHLRGDLEGFVQNGRTFGGIWTPDRDVLNEITLDPLQEPALLAPTPHYDLPPAPLQPMPHTPQIRVTDRPVLTSPLLTGHGFTLSTPVGRDSLSGLGAAVEMDAAPVAAICGDRIACGFVVGLTAPAVRVFSNDYDQSLRRAWAEVFLRSFATAAAEHCSRVVRAICWDRTPERSRAETP